MKTIISSIILAAGTLLSASMLQSCTDYDTPEPVVGDIADADSVKLELTRRVLWINIDGAAGSVVKQQVENGNLPTIASLLEHAKYSFTGLSDNHSIPADITADEENPITWTSMLTGVNADLHHVSNYSYSPDFEVTDNPVDQKISYFPSLVQQIAKSSTAVSISVVTPWKSLNRYLGDANSIVTTAGDDETESKVIDQLNNDDYRFHIVSFRDALDAGKNGGFTAQNAAYISAIKKADDRIASFVSAIKSRQNSDYEDWLIVVTSNNAGSATGDYANATDAQRDVFGIFHYDHYTPFEMKGEMLESVLFDQSYNAYAIDEDEKYSLHDKALAVEFSLQMLPKSDGSYQGNNWDKILGKDQWGIYRQREKCSVYINPHGIISVVEESVAGANDMFWHSFFYGFSDVQGTSRVFTLGYDGKKSMIKEFSGAAIQMPEDKKDFTIGTGWLPTAYRINSVRLWRTVLDDVTLEANSGVSGDLAANHPNYRDLIGEWVMRSDRVKTDYEVDEKGNSVQYWYIENNIPGMPELRFNAEPVFVKVANTLPGFRNSGNLLMENTMVAPQILYWLCGESSIDSKLTGYPFLKNYALEEQWRDL